MMHRRFLNQPIKLRWAGWETDTYALGAQGWQISAEQDVILNRIRIAINHPEAQIQGITEMEQFLFRDIMEGRLSPALPTMLNFKTLSHQIYVNTMGHDVDFSAVDFRPQIAEQEVKSLQDFAHFSTIAEVPKNEVYLHEANINQILEMALKRQEPEQEQIRQEMIKREELRNYRRGTLHTELRLVA